MKTSMQGKDSNKTRIVPSTVHFEFLDPRAESVCIAGTFNSWHPAATPMTASSPGVWTKDLKLQPGTYEYALIVDGHWRADPRSEEKVDNPFGGLNSVVKVAAPIKRRD